VAGSGTAALRERDDIILRVENLVVTFRLGRHDRVQAVSDVSFDVARGETLGLVGESGCGKSTTAKAIMYAPRPTSGRVTFSGQDLSALDREALRQLRPEMQMIYQDPISSLNPRRRVNEIVGEGLSIWGRRDGAAGKVADTLRSVGIDPEAAGDRRPHEFSGGQCQRICIARSLILEPSVLICDEPVSALDVSVQAQILNLLEDLKAEHRLTMLFIAHDLAVVRNISDRVAVMYLGKLCEVGPANSLYARPAHPYTAALIEAVPEPDPDIPIPPTALAGDLPSPLAPPSGCRFRTRCPRAQARCTDEEPILRRVTANGVDHVVACHYPLVDAEPVGIPVAVSLTSAAPVAGAPPVPPDADTPQDAAEPTAPAYPPTAATPAPDDTDTPTAAAQAPHDTDNPEATAPPADTPAAVSPAPDATDTAGETATPDGTYIPAAASQAPDATDTVGGTAPPPDTDPPAAAAQVRGDADTSGETDPSANLEP
jgi:peptide/nickel transport system ATP-binding protein